MARALPVKQLASGIDTRLSPQISETNSRRKALVKLGLVVTSIYIAPTILRIDRSARAMGPSCAKISKKC